MNIRDVNAGRYRPEQIRNGSIGDPEKVQQSTPARNTTSQSTAGNEDRVEISSSARAALTESRQTQELQLARKALHALPPADQERLSAIRSRIEDGYYNQPDVLRETMTRLAADLKDKIA